MACSLTTSWGSLHVRRRECWTCAAFQLLLFALALLLRSEPRDAPVPCDAAAVAAAAGAAPAVAAAAARPRACAARTRAECAAAGGGFAAGEWVHAPRAPTPQALRDLYVYECVAHDCSAPGDAALDRGGFAPLPHDASSLLSWEWRAAPECGGRCAVAPVPRAAARARPARSGGDGGVTLLVAGDSVQAQLWWALCRHLGATAAAASRCCRRQRRRSHLQRRPRFQGVRSPKRPCGLRRSRAPLRARAPPENQKQRTEHGETERAAPEPAHSRGRTRRESCVAPATCHTDRHARPRGTGVCVCV